MSEPNSPTRRTAFLFATWALVTIAQFLIATNPGWFSHDELQWAVRADVASPAALPWVPWSDLQTFQWRPLTFNLWLPLSWALFAHPVAWHALWVAAGAALATTLAALLLRLGATTRVARGAALAFALGPYAVYVHGWVATLADLLWVGLALALAHALLTLRAARWTPGIAALAALSAFAATGLALAAKEAAVVIAALLGLCWLLRPREGVLAAATGGAVAAAALYLALRAPVLLSGSDGAYAIDPSLVPRQWLAYHLFVLRPSTFEVPGLWNASTFALGVAAALWLALWTVVTRADRRLGVALVAGGTLALAPTLPLSLAANHYGYAFSAWCVGCVALAWPRLRFPARVLAWVFLAITLWHGANVQRELRRAGERQALFQPALVAALRTHDGVLALHAPEREWLYRRLTTRVPSWHGFAIGERVAWVASPAEADLVVAENGQLLPP